MAEPGAQRPLSQQSAPPRRLPLAARLVDALAQAVAAVALAASALMIFANVAHRYVVLGWLRALADRVPAARPTADFMEDALSPVAAVAEEVPGYLLVWISFFGAYLAQRQNAHIAFDGALRALPQTARRLVQGSVRLALLVLFGLLFAQSSRMMWVDGATEIGTAAVAQGWFMLALPVASALLFVAVAVELFRRR